MKESLDQEYSMYKDWLKLKASEFTRLGYANINEKDLWEYLSTYRWKKGRPKRYHQAVKDIMRITINDYFNFETVKAQVYDVKPMNELDLDGLI